MAGQKDKKEEPLAMTNEEMVVVRSAFEVLIKNNAHDRQAIVKILNVESKLDKFVIDNNPKEEEGE